MTAVGSQARATVPARGLLARAALAIVAALQAEVAIWGLLAPHSFYASFPGGGHHWVSAMGAYDEHLIRDFAGVGLGFTVLLVCAAIWFERRMVLVTGAAFIAATLPHFAFHLTTMGMLTTADNVASLGGFAVELALIVAVMVWVQSLPDSIGTRCLRSRRSTQSRRNSPATEKSV